MGRGGGGAVTEAFLGNIKELCLISNEKENQSNTSALNATIVTINQSINQSIDLILFLV
jgi:hypothetical protein